jgi:hypothetical protein
VAAIATALSRPPREAKYTVSRTFRDQRRERRFQGSSDEFRCRHCRTFVGPTLYGGKHRNHCPQCLYSRHVDGKTPGDRASDCGGSMAPVGAFTRSKGEHAIVHRCLTCGFERHNRVAADDDFAAVMRLPVVQPRLKRALETSEGERTA